MNLVLDPCAMSHDLGTASDQPAHSLGGGIGIPISGK